VLGPVPAGADSNRGVISPSDAELEQAWRGDIYGISASGLDVEPQDYYAMRPVSQRLGSGELMTTPSALEQAGEGAYNKLQAQAEWIGTTAVNAWQKLSTDPMGTLMQGTGSVLSFAGNALYDTALYASDQIVVTLHYLTGRLIPATDALQRNAERTESVFSVVYNIEQAIDNRDYGLAGGLAVEGVEGALLTLATRGRGGKLVDGPNTSSLKQTGGGGYTASADELYDAIRASDSDVSAIASSTGFKPGNIQKVKDHVFYNEHLLDRYVDQGIPATVGRFDSTIEQAQAWKRLESGTHTDADITWMKHETAERWYELKYDSGYSKAHDRVDWRWSGFPWGAE
jgi:hypothetical protein